MLKRRILLYFSILSLFCIQSCKKEVFDTTEPLEGDPNLECNDINYVTTAKSIFEAKCITCHGPSNVGPGNYNDLNILRSNLSSIRNWVEAGTMPPAGSPQLTEDEKASVLKWIDCGASFEGSNDTLVYETDIKPLVLSKCASCHPSAGGPGDYSVSADVKAVVNNGKFENRVLIKKDMPPSGLSQSELDKIQRWMDQGAKFQ